MGCEGCKKRREPGLQPGLRVVVERQEPSAVHGLIYGFAMTVGMLGAVVVLKPLLKKEPSSIV